MHADCLHAGVLDLPDRRSLPRDATVVLGFSFWSRQMRDDYRSLSRPTGVVPETYYLATDRETVLARVRARRGSHADDSVLTEALARRAVLRPLRG
ncbi:MAG: hypothetical protein M3Q82_01555, partial [Actinomycetota bacterium]|nr:hypothetical protein [Actinomycetota bacterium]